MNFVLIIENDYRGPYEEAIDAHDAARAFLKYDASTQLTVLRTTHIAKWLRENPFWGDEEVRRKISTLALTNRGQLTTSVKAGTQPGPQKYELQVTIALVGIGPDESFTKVTNTLREFAHAENAVRTFESVRAMLDATKELLN